MTVQTFNPTDLSQSATNWTVAQRIVGAFAPHAQVRPNLTLSLDPGNLLNGTTLTEVNAQSVGPFTPPSSGFRIDRVVIDRSTGAATIVAGTVNNLTPPAIPTGKLPVARVMLLPTTDAITNGLIIDERALVDLSNSPDRVICRATRSNVDQTGIANATYTKIIFTDAQTNVGSAFDSTNSFFKPNKEGYYEVSLQCYMSITAGHTLITLIKKNGNPQTFSSNSAPATVDTTCHCSDIIYMDGINDYIEGFVYHNNGATSTLRGNDSATYFSASLIE